MLYRAGPSPWILNWNLTSDAMPEIEIQKFISASWKSQHSLSIKKLAPEKKLIQENPLQDLFKTLNRSFFWTHIQHEAKLFWPKQPWQINMTKVTVRCCYLFAIILICYEGLGSKKRRLNDLIWRTRPLRSVHFSMSESRFWWSKKYIRA